jgi:hypothetical protein
MQGFGAASGFFANKAAGKAQNALAEENARLAQMQAADAIARGEVAEQRHRVNVKRLAGSQRASLAAQGIAIDSGSALEIQEDTARMGEMDALTIRMNAAREAWGHKVQATDYINRGRIAKADANNRATATLLSGATNIYASRFGFKDVDYNDKYRGGAKMNDGWTGY